MSEAKVKPVQKKNLGDTMMAVGVVMVCVTIIFPMFITPLNATLDQILLFGGLAIAIVGIVVRGQLRRKAKQADSESA